MTTQVIAAVRKLADTLRKRADRLREVASNCFDAEDSFSLHVRADEVTRCVASIEATLAQTIDGGGGGGGGGEL